MIKDDVTEFVEFETNDDEVLPITKCLCGTIFHPWKFIISIYPDWAKACPNCGRKFYFENAIRVFQVEEDEMSEKANCLFRGYNER